MRQKNENEEKSLKFKIHIQTQKLFDLELIKNKKPFGLAAIKQYTISRQLVH